MAMSMPPSSEGSEAVRRDMVVRRVKVNRSRTKEQMLEATGCTIDADADVVATMPKGDGDEVEVYFFQVNSVMSDDQAEREYTQNGLIPADPYSVGAVNENEPTFALNYPNATHWQDLNGKWCYVAFGQRFGKGFVEVYRYDNEWYTIWWLAGLRAESSAP